MNRADVQGLLFSSYASHPASTLILVRFAEGRPHAWLRRLLPLVSSGASWERYSLFRLNLAFTHRGLERLGLPAPTLAGFSPEFQQGMAHAARALGSDLEGAADPSTWDFTDGEARGVDAALLVYASNAAALEVKLEELSAGLARFALEFELLRSHWPSDESARAAFPEGFAEPNVRGFGRRRGSSGPRIAPGEFLLGYADEVGDRQRGPKAPARRTTREPPPMADGTDSVDLGFNGSYLVAWKLERQLGEESSSPSVRFGRTSPRNTPQGDEGDRSRHRLLGRSRLYREAESARAAEGLLFLALSADLARQFESLRTELASCWRRRSGSPRGLLVRGGVYGFLPSLRALGYFADLDESRVRL